MKGPQDLALHYVSEIDGTKQPYRLYLPSAYDSKKRLPLLLALHGTGGSQDTYFDEPTYGEGIYKKEAEKRGIVVACPHGRGTSEYRGIGEIDVLCVLEDVCRRFAIDRDRVVCSGQSMGGTGTTHLCCRYPDLFAGGAPLASTYGHLTLLENLRHVPMFYVQGAKDWPVYAREGPVPITKRLKELKFNVDYWEVPDQKHNTMRVSTPKVLDWALAQKRVTSPRRVTYRTYLPIHGRAYWTEIAEIADVGYLAALDASSQPENRVEAALQNVKQFILRPDPALLDLDKPIQIDVDGKAVFKGACSDKQQVRFDLADKVWKATVEPRKVRPYTAYHAHKIGKVVKAPSFEGTGETTMGNWLTDTMRETTKADIAIITRRHFRGLPLKDGQDLYVEDLTDALRPTECILVRVKLKGDVLLDILDDNARAEKKTEDFLVQVSGCKYSFDRSRPRGKRIVESSIDPEKTYDVVCPRSVWTRGDMLHLGDRLGKIPFEVLDLTRISAAWRHIEMHEGKLEAKLEGRIKEVRKEE